METYNINFRFRGRESAGSVHKYDSFTFVYFSDSQIIQDFGGQLEFDRRNNHVPKIGKSGADLLELINAVKNQLR
jgi:hypothetical protein